MSDRAVTTVPLQLQELDASRLPHLTDEGVLTIARRNTALRSVDLSYASPSLTDAAVRAIVTN